MALFGGKKKAEIPPMEEAGPAEAPPYPDQGAYDNTNVPIDSVITLRQQGLTNDQIVQSLQRDGYTSEQIFEAINQADIKGNVESMPQGNLQQMAPIDNPMPEQYPEYPAQGPAPAPMPMGGDSERVEEIAEGIISEKWDELTKNITKVIEWKDKTDSRLIKIEQSVEAMRSEFDNLHQALVGKISEYDKNILNVGTEIKAMEKVFQKILPTFTENVNELSRVTKGIRKKKKSA